MEASSTSTPSRWRAGLSRPQQTATSFKQSTKPDDNKRMDFAITRTQARSKRRWPLPKTHWLAAASLISSLLIIALNVVLGRPLHLVLALLVYGYWSFVFRTVIEDIKNYLMDNQGQAPTPMASKQDSYFTVFILCGNVFLLSGRLFGLFS